MNDQTKLLSNGLPPPPIPQRLREMLKDYPEHLVRLQDVLNTVVDGPKKAKGSPDYTFEVATWALEGRLGTFVHEAQDELEAAQASGDAEAIVGAKAKEFLALREVVWVNSVWITVLGAGKLGFSAADTPRRAGRKRGVE